jgi:uncharacterized protein (TIGR03083 family)
MGSAADRVRLLQTESTRLTQYLHTLPREAWSRPSACTAWQVQDVVAHLVMSAETYARSISHGLQGDTSPPEGRPAAGTLNAALAAESIAQRAIAKRESVGDDLLAVFETTADALHHLLTGLGPQDWETPCYHSMGRIPVHRMIDMRLSEVVIHGWDIRSRLVPEAPLSPKSVPVLLEWLASVTPWWAFVPGAHLATPVRYRFAVTGTVPSTIDIVVEGEKARLSEASDAVSDVTFCCETEAYILMRYGRLSLADALVTGRVVVERDQALARAFGRWFQGV